METDEKVCPFCAERIKAAAIKCRYCGEMLDDSDVGAPELVPVWRYTGKMAIWRCIEHDIRLCRICSQTVRPPSRRGEPGDVYPSPSMRTAYTGSVGTRQRLSEVGDQTGGALACPRCGGTQFTAKRSNKGKLIGFTTLGVGGLIAPKSQVKCVACGLMFKRG